ncbi:MAG: hypothetical protein K2X50_02050 [Gammaproteobacteria bacterium]|nr:hypothetical protein [Gammaproteobacteria bacterium]
MHVYVLSNGATLKARPGDPGKLKDPSAVGPAETSAENWQVGDEVETVVLTALEWVTHNNPPGAGWIEKRSPVVINRSRGNSFLILMEYIKSPLTWEGSRIEDIGFTWPHTNEKVTWLRTGSHGLLLPDPGINLEDWKAGDSLRFRAYESTHGITWLIYNERTSNYAYPFVEQGSIDQWSPATQRLQRITNSFGETTLHFDRSFHFRLPTSLFKPRGKQAIFKEGDSAIVKIKKQMGNQGYGIALQNPASGVEVMVRATQEYDGYPGYWQLSGLDSNGSFSIVDYPYKIKLQNSADYETVHKFNSVAIAVNATNNGFLLLDGLDFWSKQGLLSGSAETDNYTIIPAESIVLKTGSSGVAYKGIFPDWTGHHMGVFPQDWWKP